MITVYRINVANKVRLFGQILFSLFFLHGALEAHAGQVSVSDGGTASYSMPIAVPPGIAGMAPNLGLLYSGSAVNGPVGYGWTIQGISMITRCAANKLIDGTSHGVDYTANDKLCLDGQRLIQTDANGVVVNANTPNASNPSLTNPFQQNDSLGGNGQVREYRTEKDMYARIRAYGAAGGNALNGPAYFKVWTKSGQIYEYGTNSNTTANAQISSPGQAIVAWPVSRISDTLGNYIDFQYEQRDPSWGSVPSGGNATGHEWNLLEVRYTGNASQAPTNKVVFTYIDRPDNPGGPQDRAETYHQGNKNLSIRLLNSIRTYVNWPAAQGSQPSNAVKVKTIKLTYDNGPVTNRSRLKKITECAGAAETACLPATTFNYSAGGNASYIPNTVFKSTPLATLPMQNQEGSYGVIQGDFNGDGKMDFIRWSNNPSENQLYLSTAADAVFSKASNFNITDQNLFKNDGCYLSLITDINGDGLPDIIRYSSSTNLDGAACPSYGSTIIYLNNGNGSFTQLPYQGPVLERLVSKGIDNCLVSRNKGYCAEPGDHKGWTRGANFFFIDVDGDGKLDIITTVLPKYGIQDDSVDPCASTICTRVYKSNGDGSFTEILTNLAYTSIYTLPSAYNGLGSSRNVADVDGDGLADITAIPLVYFNKNPVFKSRGDGNFDGLPSVGNCLTPIDFNGDGRSDCLAAAPAVANNALMVSAGSNKLSALANFNLINSGQELAGTGIGIQIADIDGDGRSDILRWSDDPSQNAVFLSNGDGTFRPDASFNLKTASDQLQKSDGTANFILGDFTGHGNAEILRLSANPIAGNDARTNVLYVKNDPTPPDQLISVISGSGLTSTFTWVPLTNSVSGSIGTRYFSDRGTANAAKYPMVDITSPTYVVATLTTDSGVGTQTIATEYMYAGLKVAYDGRGWLGYRETKRQSQAPDGNLLTVWTQYLMADPYIGMASVTQTLFGPFVGPPQVLSKTSYIYCDTTSGTAAVNADYNTPCLSAAKVKHPYLYKSVEQGSDLIGTALPTVTTTNTFNNSGDPTQIVAITQGTALGMSQQFTKTTTNQYTPDNMAGDNWILGRLQGSTVLNSVPNSLGNIATSPGTAPNASATQGTGVLPPLQPSPLPSVSWLTPILMILELN